jgi:hypothetical protein
LEAFENNLEGYFDYFREKALNITVENSLYLFTRWNEPPIIDIIPMPGIFPGVDARFLLSYILLLQRFYNR